MYWYKFLNAAKNDKQAFTIFLTLKILATEGREKQYLSKQSIQHKLMHFLLDQTPKLIKMQMQDACISFLFPLMLMLNKRKLLYDFRIQSKA